MFTTTDVARRVTEYWMNVTRRGPGDCWPWSGYLNEDGYGEFFWEGQMRGAHELARTFATGEQRLRYLDTCHSCGSRPCCNPAHIRFDTRQSNVDDTVRMGRNHRPVTKLMDSDVRTIRERRQAGAPQQDLADQYGVSDSLISEIVNGKRRMAAGGPIATRREYRKRTGD